MPRELVVVQVGQCGNQLGSAFWDLMLQEARAARQSNTPDALSSLFTESRDASGAEVRSSTGSAMRIKARCVPIDMEEGVLNAMMRGPLAPLFDTCHFVSDVSGAGNNWAVGYMEYGDKYCDAIENSVRNAVEACDSIQTFVVTHSLSGGTGSGLGSRCLSILSDAYPDVFRCSVVVMPSSVEDVVTAPYNTGFALRELIEQSSVVIPLDNDALAAASERAIGKGTAKRGTEASDQGAAFNVAQATKSKLPFDSMNAIGAQMLSNLTCSMRFPGSLNMDINEIATNLVPYPRQHILLSAIAPLSTSKHVHVGAKNVDTMFAACLERDHQLVMLNPREHTFLGSAFLCRGADVDVGDISRNIPRMRDKMKMVYWNEDGFKTALCSVPPLGQSQSMLMLSNHCGIRIKLASIRDKFKKLYSVRSHVHHYESYVELPYFDDTLDIVGGVIDDYAYLDQVQPPKACPRSLRGLLL
jgi:tubulin epsilon